MPVTTEEYIDLYESVADMLEEVSPFGTNEIMWRVAKNTDYNKTYDSEYTNELNPPVKIFGYFVVKGVMDLDAASVRELINSDAMLIVSEREMKKLSGWSLKDQVSIQGTEYNLKKGDPITYGDIIVRLFNLEKAPLLQQESKQVEAFTPSAQTPVIAPIKPEEPQAEYALPPQDDFSDAFEKK